MVTVEEDVEDSLYGDMVTVEEDVVSGLVFANGFMRISEILEGQRKHTSSALLTEHTKEMLSDSEREKMRSSYMQRR